MSTSYPPDRDAENGSGEDGSEATSAADLLVHYDVRLLRAPNPGPLTLTGTTTWVVGRRPTWVIDPGPLIDEHLESLFAEIEARGGLGGVLLTHDHQDHSEAVGALLETYPAPLAAGRGAVDVQLSEQVRFGPFEAVATPGPAADPFALWAHGAS